MNAALTAPQAPHTSAHALAMIALVCMAGMLLGGVKVRGTGLGTAGVLFAGILAGALTTPVEPSALALVKDLGLVLFVFGIGLQLGPGFIASLRGTGVRLNLLAAGIVALGALTAAGLGALLRLDPSSIPGVYAGATTNTPSLGAAQQTLAGLPGGGGEGAVLPALAYSVTYPVAIVGMILVILALKRAFGLDPRRDAERFAAERRRSVEPVERRTLVVQQARCEGGRVAAVIARAGGGVVVSRLRPASNGRTRAASGDDTLHQGDLLLAVGTAGALDRFQDLVGGVSGEDLAAMPGPVTQRRILVTSKAAVAKTFDQLGLERQHGVVVTRITRAGLEMTAAPDLRLQFGDTVQAVGEPEALGRASEVLGDSPKALNQMHWAPLFGGVAAAIALASAPIAVPGLPQPLRPGLAAGSLIVAMVIGRLGRAGPLAPYMPFNANVALRDLGIALFFASVGLLAGPAFFGLVFSRRGLVWMGAGACVTVLPLLVVGAAAVARGRLDFVTLSGLLAGSMTDPPALAFATNLCDSDAPMTAYAAVYPLSTLLRILSTQALTLALCT